MKNVEFRGSSLSDLRDFPDPAKRETGYQIDGVQNGLDPNDWKPMETIYVLHCFKKTAPKTSKADKDLAAKR